MFTVFRPPRAGDIGLCRNEKRQKGRENLLHFNLIRSTHRSDKSRIHELRKKGFQARGSRMRRWPLEASCSCAFKLYASRQTTNMTFPDLHGNLKRTSQPSGSCAAAADTARRQAPRLRSARDSLWTQFQRHVDERTDSWATLHIQLLGFFTSPEGELA